MTIATGLMTKLRQATQVQHNEVETKLAWLEHVRSEAQYKHLLKRLYGFYKPLEDSLDDLAHTCLVDWPERQKAAKLEADLHFWKLSPNTIEQKTASADVSSPSQLFGVLYVVEGASLGGRVIYKQLLRQGLPSEGLSFYRGYGQNTALKWKAFGRQLDSFQLDERATIEAANQTFASFSDWLSC